MLDPLYAHVYLDCWENVRLALSYKKGVSSTVVCSTLQEAREDGVFEEAAWELGRKLSLKLKSLEDNVKRRRFFSAGARKGHDLSTLNEVYYALFKS